MKIFFDTEFIEDGKTIELLSIGAIREDGKVFYAESSEANLAKANQWVKDNVIVHLKGGEYLKSRSDIAKEFLEFAGEKPQFWAYYSAYDWVVLCQLYGQMIDLPQGWPMFCRDIKQLMDSQGITNLVDLGPQVDEHHALADAIWNRRAYEHLTK